MKPVKVTDDIYMLSVNLKDSALLFEEMWEIPQGVTVNSFIVKGEKTAIIDGVCGWDGVPETLFRLLDELQIKPEDIDYLIINHMEPDHSGWIESFKKITNQFEVYCTAKAADLLKAFYGQTENVHIVKNGDELDLGGGKKLKFAAVPGVHWPDTMMTMELSTKTLFPCDMFGSFGQTKHCAFDEDMTAEDQAYFYEEEIRYFSNVLATFQKPVQKAIAVAKEFAPAVIASGHGPIYRQNPAAIIQRYEDIVNFREGKPLPEITILWASMYGMTEKAVKYAEQILQQEKMPYHILRVPYAATGEILSKSIRSSGLLIAAPTYENKMFPAMAAALDEMGRKKISPKKVAYMGSYGWSGGAKKEMDEILAAAKLDWEVVDACEFNGAPKSEDEQRIEAAVKALIAAIR